MGLDVGVCILPEFDWQQAQSKWKEAEAAGFATAWTYDHLSWRTLRDGPWYGALPLLSAVAAVTTTIRLGTLVTTPNFRHPVPLAKELMTLDEISGGRLEVGIGAGANTHDATVLGRPAWSAGERAGYFEEFVRLLDLLLTEPAVTFQGELYSALDARQIPGGVQRPRAPFTIAGIGSRSLQLAATYGSGWVTYGAQDVSSTPDLASWLGELRAQSELVSAACLAGGRDPATLRRSALLGLNLPCHPVTLGEWEEMAGGLEEAGFDQVIVHWPRPWDPDLPGISEALLSEIRR